MGGGGYDFITIRSNLDSATYCIDMVCQLAEENPGFRFLVIGRGDYFKYHIRPRNITWIDKFLEHEEMLYCVNQAKCALMPTRRDTQGVMSCELLTYGIPLITSELPVCREIFGGLHNVAFLENKAKVTDLKTIYENLLKKYDSSKINRYGYEQTVRREEEIIRHMK